MNSIELRKLAKNKIAEARTAGDLDAQAALMAEAKTLEARAKLMDEADEMEADLAEVRNARPMAEVATAKIVEDTDELRAFARLVEGRASLGQNIATAADGGHLVPTTIYEKVLTEAVDYAPMLDESVTNVVKTAGANPMKFNGSGGREAQLIGEGEDFEINKSTLRPTTLTGFKVGDAAVATVEFLQDSAVDANAWFVSEMGPAIGQGANKFLTIGSGVNQPTGIATALESKATGVQIPAANATAAVVRAWVDELRKLQYGVKAAYRLNGKYMFSSDIEAIVSGVKDENGRYIWTSAVDGKPARLFGKEVVINDHMPTEAGKVYAIFGDIKAGYTVRIGQEMQIDKLNETFILSGQKGWLGSMRADGNIVQPAALAALKNAAAEPAGGE